MEDTVNTNTCTFCGKEFSDYAIAVGSYNYHPNCFVCSRCREPLKESNFSIKNVSCSLCAWFERVSSIARNAMRRSLERSVQCVDKLFWTTIILRQWASFSMWYGLWYMTTDRTILCASHVSSRSVTIAISRRMCILRERRSRVRSVPRVSSSSSRFPAHCVMVPLYQRSIWMIQISS